MVIAVTMGDPEGIGPLPVRRWPGDPRVKPEDGARP
jgi:hypothetical protein